MMENDEKKNGKMREYDNGGENDEKNNGKNEDYDIKQ